MENQEKPNIAMRIGIILGIIIILFIVSIGIIKLVPRAISSLANVSVSFSSLFAQKESIAVTLSPSTVPSGSKTAIAFTHTGKTKDGYYSLSYDCQTGSRLSYTNGSSTLVSVPCSQPYPFSSPSNEISLIASIPVNQTAESLPITIMFTPTGAASASVSGSATLNIVAATSSTGVITTIPPNNTVVTPPSTTTYVPPAATPGAATHPPSTTYVNPNAHADLAVAIVDEGIADPSTGNFVSTRNFAANNTVVIKFQVTNIGNKSTGLWGFQTTQPMTNPVDSVKSAAGLHSLAPGQSTGPITLALSGINPIGGTVVITAAPGYAASEIQTSNNSIQVVIPSGNGYNGGGYGYGASDLSVVILDTGILNGYNGQYVQTNSVRTTDQVRIHFVVKNLGGTATGPWTLTTNLPVSNNYNNNSTTNYYSGNNSNSNGAIQASLAPGAIADFFLTFTGLQTTGYSNITITVNPAGGYADANPSNNTATTYLNVTY
jgi:hypothetical protein